MNKIAKIRRTWLAWNSRKLEDKDALLKIGEVLASAKKKRGRKTIKVAVPDEPEITVSTEIINPNFTEENGKFKCNFCLKEFDLFEEVQKHLNYYKTFREKQKGEKHE